MVRICANIPWLSEESQFTFIGSQGCLTSVYKTTQRRKQRNPKGLLAAYQPTPADSISSQLGPFGRGGLRSATRHIERSFNNSISPSSQDTGSQVKVQVQEAECRDPETASIPATGLIMYLLKESESSDSSPAVVPWGRDHSRILAGRIPGLAPESVERQDGDFPPTRGGGGGRILKVQQIADEGRGAVAI